MKEKLLTDWEIKYERINWELKDNERKLEKVIQRQKMLGQDIAYQIVFSFICVLIILFLTLYIESVGVFQYLYCIVLCGIVIAAVIYNGYQMIKRTRRYSFHMNAVDPIEYPKPETQRSNYPLHIPPSYYAECKCIEWLLHQYTVEIVKMEALKRKIEETPEQDLGPLWEELESIVVYERVGCARG